CYYSRSRKKLWRKGEESGNVQELLSAWFDCDGDTLLLKVRQIGGAACHEGFRSCFFRRVIPDAGCVFFSTGGWIFQIRKNAFMVKCGQPVRGQLARFAVRRYTQGPAGIGRIELLCGI
ncbi:MAG: phosphoribosyl-AMP cyclohydrolase, partial [Actinomycetota bacterium]